MNKYLLSIATSIIVIEAIGATAETTGKAQTENKIKVWQANGPLGLSKPTDLDTTLEMYHINDLALHRTIAFQSLGNLGTPGISKIYSDRESRSNFIFFQPYSLYYTSTDDIKYFNTKVPYTNISYYNGGQTNRKQQAISGIFAINITPHFNMGMYGKWQNNYGSYDNQSTKNYNTGFFGSYIHRHHELMSNISFNGYRAKENGGFTETNYITDPKNTGELDGYNIPTYFDDDVTSKLVNWNAYLNYKYNFGFDKEIQVNSDSTTTEFIPVSSLIYTFRNEANYKRYKEDVIGSNGGMATDSLYKHIGVGANHLVNNTSTTDSVHYWEMNHTFGISLNEEFNSFGKFGVAGYLSYVQKRYGSLDHVNTYTENPQLAQTKHITVNENGTDSLGRFGEEIWNEETKTKLGIGAIVSKRKGEHLQFNFNGEYFFKDEKNTGGTYKVSGDVKSQFNIGRNLFAVHLNALRENYCPDYFEEHYFGNRLQWNNDFDNQSKTVLEGSVGAEKIYLYKENDSSFISKVAPELGLTFKVNETTLGNYVYWGTDATPKQTSSTISITNLTLQEKLKFWYLHFDNELTLQYHNADSYILDLPTLCLYSNLYLKTKPLFKALTLQLGVDLRYNTKYYAPAYMPATGMYYAQNQIELGDYPYYDAYLSFHLRTIRFFFEYSHLNRIWTNNNNYLVTPGYALDPNYIKLGVSVNFAN